MDVVKSIKNVLCNREIHCKLLYIVVKHFPALNSNCSNNFPQNNLDAARAVSQSEIYRFEIFSTFDTFRETYRTNIA